jgi:hypothetical protein
LGATAFDGFCTHDVATNQSTVTTAGSRLSPPEGIGSCFVFLTFPAPARAAALKFGLTLPPQIMSNTTKPKLKTAKKMHHS